MSRLARKFRSKVRPKFQRVFIRWLQDSHRKFAIPLRFIRRTDKQIEIGFVGISSHISVHVSSSELSVCVVMNGAFLDFLLDIDLVLKRCALGYYCELCEQTQREYFTTREDAWQKHQFEPLLVWVNEKLASARWLRICSADCGSSWASLIFDESDFEPGDIGISNN